MSAPAAPAVPGTRSQLNGLEVWFLTGSQHLYGEETLRQVAEQSQQSPARSARHATSRCVSSGSRCSTDAGSDPPGRCSTRTPTTT